MVFASFFLATIVSSSVSAEDEIFPQGELVSPQIEIDGNNLSVGEIVANGIRQENGDCSFEDVGSAFKVKISAPDNGITRWLAILLDDDCVAVVNGIWVGALETGPSAVIDPLIKLLDEESIPIPEEPEISQTNRSINDQVFTMAPTATKTSEQVVYMYGYGGQSDKLTRKSGKITFTYNGSTATITSQSSSCVGSKILDWEWVVDGCLRTGYDPGPAEVVFREGRGNYHCKPVSSFPCNSSEPDGYYHSLFDIEDGDKNGIDSASFFL